MIIGSDWNTERCLQTILAFPLIATYRIDVTLCQLDVFSLKRKKINLKVNFW